MSQKKVHVGLDATVVVVAGESRVAVEEAGLPAAHGAVGEQGRLPDADRAQVVQ